MTHSYRLGLVTRFESWSGRIFCHRGCVYTVLQTGQRHGVYSAAYGRMHHKDALKSLEIRVEHSPGFGWK